MSFSVTLDGSDGYTKLVPAPTGELLTYITSNIHTAATLAPTYAKSGSINNFTLNNTFAGVIYNTGGFSGSTMGLSGALSGTIATFSGLIQSGSAQISGAGTFTGLITANGGLSGTGGTFSGLLSGSSGLSITAGASTLAVTNAAHVPLRVAGATSQTAHLQDWVVGGSVASWIGSNGSINPGGGLKMPNGSANVGDTDTWTASGDGTTRSLDASTATSSDVANALANLINDLPAMGILSSGA